MSETTTLVWLDPADHLPALADGDNMSAAVLFEAAGVVWYGHMHRGCIFHGERDRRSMIAMARGEGMMPKVKRWAEMPEARGE